MGVAWMIPAVTLALTLSAHAAGPTECRPETARFCAAVEGDIFVYQCLERSLELLGPACREAVLRANPVLRSELEIRAACSVEVPRLCPGPVHGDSLSTCLQSKHAQTGEGCLRELMRSNAAFREQVLRERAASAAAVEAEELRRRNEAKVAAELEEDRRRKAAAEERIRARLAECRARLTPRVENLCDPYSRIPAPTPEQSQCMSELTQALTTVNRRTETQRIAAETGAWSLCKSLASDQSYRSCAKKRLQQGDDMTTAGNSCDPFHLRCLDELTDRKPVADPGTRRFLYHFCATYSDYYATPAECAEKEAPFWMGFYHQPRDGRLVVDQLAEIQTKCETYLTPGRAFMRCIRDLPKLKPQLRATRNQRMLIHLCHQPPKYRECVVARFFRLPDYIQALGYPSGQREQEQIHQACELQCALQGSSPGSSSAPNAGCR